MKNPSAQGIEITNPTIFESQYRAKKALGQNFMMNQGLIGKIVNVVNSYEPKSIIEIGSGLGAFTKEFLKQYVDYKNFAVVEFDRELSAFIKAKYPELNVVNQDVLSTNFQEVIETHQLSEPVHIFGALPYNISKPIIRHFLENPILKTATYIIQKEVAVKYISKPPEASKLGLISQLTTTAKKHFDISAGNFKPQPNVTSSLISFVKLPEDQLLPTEERRLVEKLIKMSFTRPRKTIYNNIRSKHPESGQFEITKKRPAQLSLDQYIELNKELTNIS